MASKYQQLSQREHIIKKPNMYIGSLSNEEVKKFVFEDGKFVMKKFNYNPGLFKIIDEAISNASDHLIENNGCNIIKIGISNNPLKISIWNNSSEGIPIEKKLLTVGEHKGREVFICEMIFGELLTSSNYSDKDRIANGTNGIGIKLTNIYSKEFTIETVTNGIKLTKRYYDSMSREDECVIEELEDGKKRRNNKIDNSVCISFIPDLSMFKDKNSSQYEVNDDFIKLIIKKVYDLSYCCYEIKKNSRIYLNDQLVTIRDFNDYIKLYGIDNMRTCKCDNFIIGLAYTPDDPKIISFINNNPNEGGTHTDFIMKNIFKIIKDKSKSKNKSKLQLNYMTSHLTLFVNGQIKNPTYDSQCKERLKNSFNKNSIKFNEDFDKLVEWFSKSGIMKYMNALVDASEIAALKKTDGNKTTKMINISNYERANKAGGRESHKCKLIITEGLSAMTFALKGRSIINPDYYGVFSIRGKMLNTKNASVNDVKNNAEINNIKQILGLKQGKVYDKESIKELNYGGILILTDQDLDGYHIKGLIINFIHTYWKELIQVPEFFTSLQTPILKAFPKPRGAPVVFYSQVDYNNWLLNNDVNKYNIHYYKGLGSSTNEEVKECFKTFNNNLLEYLYEPEIEDESVSPKMNKTDEAIELAFSKNRSDDRKEWLRNYDKNVKPDIVNNKIKISEFINKELIHFSNYDNIRSIPSIYDGLKPSQRKILFTVINNHIDSQSKRIKVNNLASKVSDQTCYLHGEQSLVEAIVGMAQDFPGKNNINLLIPDGEFGSIRCGGNDHSSARYIFTYLNKLTYKIFRKEDECILKYNEEEGQIIEPEVYYPIIPMVLINGSTGIGTGYKSDIPCFNVKDVINNLKMIINNPNEKTIEKLKVLDPYYNCCGHKDFNYPNIIDKIDDHLWISKAKYQIINNRSQNILHIEALPIGCWTADYTDPANGLFAKLMNDKDKDGNKIIPKVINYVNNSNPNNVNIDVVVNGLSSYFKNDSDELLKTFKLTSQINTKNMYLHENNGGIDRLSRYDNVNDIIIDFYNTRYQKYEERKNEYLKILKYELDFINYKVKFIDEKIKGLIKVDNVKINVLISQLETRGYPKLGSNYKDENKSYNYLTDIKILYLTKEYRDKLHSEYLKKKEEYENHKKLTIKELWLNEIKEFEIEYDKINGNDKKAINKK